MVLGRVSLNGRVRGWMRLMGGSHAQHEGFHRLFLDAAMKAGLQEDAQMLLERVAARYPVPFRKRSGCVIAVRA